MERARKQEKKWKKYSDLVKKKKNTSGCAHPPTLETLTMHLNTFFSLTLCYKKDHEKEMETRFLCKSSCPKQLHFFVCCARSHK